MGLFVLVKVKHLLKYFSWIEARVLMSNLQNWGHREEQIWKNPTQSQIWFK